MRSAPHSFILLLCSLSFQAFAQTGSQSIPPAANQAASSANSDRRITLDVVVTDKSGNPISGLQQRDFTLIDDKRPQSILSFQEQSLKADTDLQAILLVDAVNTGFQGVGYERQALEKFFRQDGGKLPVPMSLALLTDTSFGQSAVTSDGNVLVGALDSNQTGLRAIQRSQGFYGAADRVQISLNALQRLASSAGKEPGEKLLIWFSPGWPLLTSPNVQQTSKDQEALFSLAVSISAALQQARLTLYNVDPLGTADAGSFQTFYYKDFVKGVSSANKMQNGNLAVQVLAVQSGGLVLNSSNNINKMIASCLADAKTFYILTFDAPRADHPNEYHSLQVTIDKPGLTARTRTGYYAQR